MRYIALAGRLADSLVRALPAPPTGNRISYDEEVKGFGFRITAAGARSFILNYRAYGRERRITIGSFPDWAVKAAREQARSLKRQIDIGEDPMADRDEDRSARSVAQFCDLFEAEYLPSRRTPPGGLPSLIRLYIRPRFGKLKVASLRHVDVAALHREIAKRAPYRANRMLAVLSMMIGHAVKEGGARTTQRAGSKGARREARAVPLAGGDHSAGRSAGEHPEKISANAIRSCC